MAKSKSTFEFQGTVGEVTFVRSKTYGKHVRAKRGTYKPAEVNEEFKKASEKTLRANRPAQIVNNAIEQYREYFKGGQLWQYLNSVFQKQLREGGAFDFARLEPFEIWESYRLGRLLTARHQVSTDLEKGVISVTLSYRTPRFPKSKFINGYRLGVIAIFPDGLEQEARTTSLYTSIIPLKEKATPRTFDLPLPSPATSCLVCVRIDGCYGDKVNTTPATIGMRVVWAGEIK